MEIELAITMNVFLMFAGAWTVLFLSLDLRFLRCQTC